MLQTASLFLALCIAGATSGGAYPSEPSTPEPLPPLVAPVAYYGPATPSAPSNGGSSPLAPPAVAAAPASAGLTNGTDDAYWEAPASDDGPVMHYGAELILMQLHVGSLSIGVLDGVTDDTVRLTPAYQIRPAYRFWLGREAANGLGWEISGFHFDANDRLLFDEESGSELRTRLDFYTVFFELTQRGSFAGWDLVGSMGAAIGGVTDDFDLPNDFLPLALDRRFDGGGLTFSVQVDRPIGSSLWQLYGSFRGTFLLGRTDFQLTVSEIPDLSEDVEVTEIDISGKVTNQIISVWQLRLGAERDWATDYGMAFARFGIESQLWEMPPVVFGLGDQNIGLFGPTFTVGLTR